MGAGGSAEQQPEPDWGACPTSSSASSRGPGAARTRRTGDRLLEYRLRFFNFNMANSSSFSSVDDLQGPGGRGSFLEAIREPLADGRGCADLAFATLVETRLNLGDWVQGYLAENRGSHLDSVLAQNARREGGHHTRSLVRSFAEGIAASYNGNLKSMLAFCGGDFREDPKGSLFGRLTEAKVAGLPVPNPKKAFMGRCVVEKDAGRGDFRLCFVGAHFPIAKLAAAIEEAHNPTRDPLQSAKVALARTLRKVLRKASRRGIADDRTAIFIQGDLNSRTVLQGRDEASDVLMELLRDNSMQAAIQHGLGVPVGRWRELDESESAHDLPVTYKFSEQVASSKPQCSPARALTIGDIVQSARLKAMPPRKPGGDVTAHPASLADIYKRTLSDLGDEKLASWGVVFKKHDFRAFRFPACADRVIFWAPDVLGDRMSWELPRGGYEVNHGQPGSDHRPVALEVVLRVAHVPLRKSHWLNEASEALGGIAEEIFKEDSPEDDDDDLEPRADFIAGEVTTPRRSPGR